MNRPRHDTASYLDRLSPEQRRMLIRRLNRKERAATAGTLPDDTIRVRRESTPVPLSFAQERLWFLDQLEGPNAAYNIPLAWHMAGRLDVAALENSLRKIMQRHEALRTRVAMENGNPVQVFTSGPDLALPVTDLGALPESERRAEMTRRIEAEDLKPFDRLTGGPLVRAELLRLTPRAHVLLLTFHHMVFDGWSLGILSRELMAAYPFLLSGQMPVLPELAIQYGDFSLWQRDRFRTDRLAQRMAFWKKELDGAPTLLELPLDRPHPPRRSYQGRRLTFIIPPAWTTKLKRLARDAGATLFMALLAVYTLLLSRYTSQRDIVIGTAVSGRDRADLESLIGFFINTLVLRIRWSGNPSFRQFLSHVKQVVLDARTHQDMPFEKLVESLCPERNLSHTPLFQAAFVMQNMPLAPLDLPDLVITPLETDRLTAKFDLNLIMQETESGLLAGLEYSTDIFVAETIARMAGHFRNLLKAAISDPAQSIFKFPLMTPAEEASLSVQWAPAAQGDATPCPVHKLFEERVALEPQAVALVFGRQRLGYQEINTRANRLAHYLRSMGVGPEVCVALHLERSPELVIAILAVLKAGGAYIPLDPDIPVARLAFILQDSRARVLITEETLGYTAYPENTTRVYLDRDQKAIGRMSAENPSIAGHADNLAYIIYTSGSTGTPKGSLVTHANVVRLFTTTRALFCFSEKDVFTLFHSCAFDFSVWEIWGALLHGGTLVIVPYMLSRSPDEFHALLCTEKVTVVNQTPSAFGQLIQADRQALQGPNLALKWVIFGGEALDPRILEPWFAAHGDQGPRLVNMYGITETTVHVTWYPLTVSDVNRPGSIIGRPIPDLGLHILDAHMHRVPPGIKGEIYVEGPGICRGYLRRPDLTAGVFVPNPFAVGAASGARLYKTGDLGRYMPDGHIEYLGRKDQQIKIRGFRIEIGEIETVLCQYPEICQAVVTVHPDTLGNGQLTAYLVCSAPVASEAVSDFLKTRLPAYMVPAAYTQLDQLPLTANNKIDRKKLPQPDPLIPVRHYTPPQNRTEKILAEIWGHLLKRDRIGRHDDFFSIGGHSLLAVQIISRVRKAFQVTLPVRTVFEKPTIADLAGWIEQARTAREAVMAPSGALDEEIFDDGEEGEI
jgi:amino acid adenylation domain-containing protein